MSKDELIRLTAREAVSMLRDGEVSPRELIDAALERIEAVDGAVNAMPTLCIERARDQAIRLEAGMGFPVEPGPGWLAGLPIAIKELENVAGVRTTYASPIFADKVPERSDLLVERLEENGTSDRMSNTRSRCRRQHFNEVHGETRNRNTALRRRFVRRSAAALRPRLARDRLRSRRSLRTPASLFGSVPSAGARRAVIGTAVQSVADPRPDGTQRRRCRTDADAMCGWQVEIRSRCVA
jgi:amidase